MHRFAIVALTLGSLAVVRADIMPVAGFTAGTFSNASGGSTASGNVWTYGNGNGASNVEFNSAVFSGNTPAQFLFGALTVHNTSNGDNGTFAADLGLFINFTTPFGQSVSFTDGLELLAVSGSHAFETLVLDFGGLPGPRTFAVGNDNYTVTLDGYFDGQGNQISELVIPNLGNSDSSGTAYLKGTITAVDPPGLLPPLSSVPEPGSVVLLLTGIAGAILSVRRKGLGT